MLIRAKKEPGIERSAFIVALYFFCALAFGIDIILEIAPEMREGQHPSFLMTVHLVMELFAETALILAVILSFQSYFRLREISKHEFDLGHAIRTGFDKTLMEKFHVWSLTKSEREIAVLAVRGLSIAEISVHRKSKEGTVKSHLHNVYVKASVGSRSELLAVLMDELLYSQDLSLDPVHTPTVVYDVNQARVQSAG
ncbi:helix-turn-helix transcriptional regulator [Aliiroseovarius lamellibrachiae]|uniref:helix-turn-helix transcriptional regulator n=1 Tax=Aliiroseovarius lamellibrachiae TaxID=1924933 RepID=UPI001BE07FCC|nr:helix-turn-helix transcriptional regulator [Aliiroseovarius lamellibrachiae]MBT2132660.1 helix-turn-helix transcriptional regulator [Aliiroseovarius lamellibrachiae]